MTKPTSEYVGEFAAGLTVSAILATCFYTLKMIEWSWLQCWAASLISMYVITQFKLRK